MPDAKIQSEEGLAKSVLDKMLRLNAEESRTKEGRPHLPDLNTLRHEEDRQNLLLLEEYVCDLTKEFVGVNRTEGSLIFVFQEPASLLLMGRSVRYPGLCTQRFVGGPKGTHEFHIDTSSISVPKQAQRLLQQQILWNESKRDCLHLERLRADKQEELILAERNLEEIKNVQR